MKAGVDLLRQPEESHYMQISTADWPFDQHQLAAAAAALAKSISGDDKNSIGFCMTLCVQGIDRIGTKSLLCSILYTWRATAAVIYKMQFSEKHLVGTN